MHIGKATEGEENPMFMDRLCLKYSISSSMSSFSTKLFTSSAVCFCDIEWLLMLFKLSGVCMYVGNSIRKLQIQVATYVFELSAGNCHR
jgi:hypothetical protein